MNEAWVLEKSSGGDPWTPCDIFTWEGAATLRLEYEQKINPSYVKLRICKWVRAEKEDGQ